MTGDEWIDNNHPVFTGNMNPDRGSLTAEIGHCEATVSPLYHSNWEFRARAVNKIGRSGWSETVTVE